MILIPSSFFIMSSVYLLIREAFEIRGRRRGHTFNYATEYEGAQTHPFGMWPI